MIILLFDDLDEIVEASPGTNQCRGWMERHQQVRRRLVRRRWVRRGRVHVLTPAAGWADIGGTTVGGEEAQVDGETTHGVSGEVGRVKGEADIVVG